MDVPATVELLLELKKDITTTKGGKEFSGYISARALRKFARDSLSSNHHFND